MTTPSAKDLLAQADELIRRTRNPADLPVLTELVGDPSQQKLATPVNPVIEVIPDLTDMVEAPASRSRGSALEVEEISFEEFKREVRNERREPSLGFDDRTGAPHDIFPTAIKSSAAPTPRAEGEAIASYTRDQFHAAVAAKLEQMQHSVYSQVMQQLELHATGEMKRKLREALEPALTQVALDLAAQVAEETAIQVQQIVANAVDDEVARLREQIQNKRRDGK
jgi:hypothetical protein